VTKPERWPITLARSRRTTAVLHAWKLAVLPPHLLSATPFIDSSFLLGCSRVSDLLLEPLLAKFTILAASLHFSHQGLLCLARRRLV